MSLAGLLGMLGHWALGAQSVEEAVRRLPGAQSVQSSQSSQSSQSQKLLQGSKPRGNVDAQVAAKSYHFVGRGRVEGRGFDVISAISES